MRIDYNTPWRAINSGLESLATIGHDIALAIICGGLIAGGSLYLLWETTRALSRLSHPGLFLLLGTVLRMGLLLAALVLLAHSFPPVALLSGCLSIVVTRALILRLYGVGQ